MGSRIPPPLFSAVHHSFSAKSGAHSGTAGSAVLHYTTDDAADSVSNEITRGVTTVVYCAHCRANSYSISKQPLRCTA